MRIIKFEADWCGPCKASQAHIDKIGLQVERVDVDASPELAQEYKVASLPTVVVLDDDGNEVERIIGFNPNALSRLKEGT